MFWRAGEGGRGVVRNSDVHLADGHIPVVVIGDVLDHHVLKGGQRQVEPIGSHLSPRNAAGVVHSTGLSEVDRHQEALGILLDDDRVLWTVPECWRLVVNTHRVSIVKAEMSELGRLVLTAHQLKLKAGKFVETDHTENDESSGDGEGQLDHGELAIISWTKWFSLIHSRVTI